LTDFKRQTPEQKRERELAKADNDKRYEAAFIQATSQYYEIVAAGKDTWGAAHRISKEVQMTHKWADGSPIVVNYKTIQRHGSKAESAGKPPPRKGPNNKQPGRCQPALAPPPGGVKRKQTDIDGEGEGRREVLVAGEAVETGAALVARGVRLASEILAQEAGAAVAATVGSTAGMGSTGRVGLTGGVGPTVAVVEGAVQQGDPHHL